MTTPLRRFNFDRIPFYLVRKEKSAFKETYGGPEDIVVSEGQYLKPAGSDSKTVLLFMHPTGLLHLLPMPTALAAAGVPVLCCGSRYPHNDSGLIMEKVVLDLGEYVKYAHEKLGFTNVILAGWSGGGSLSMFYQSEAEHPSITATPAGAPCAIVSAGLIPAQGVLQMAAHASRAIILTEWLDASIVDEADPYNRDPGLDLYDPANPNQPPYSAEFLERYGAAQIARSRKIDAWVRDQLETLRRRSPNAPLERSFVVHGTMADPRWLDPKVDPNDRPPGRSFLGDPKVVNMMPAGLARYSSLRSWLSQWSYTESRANGPLCAGRISVPVLVVQNSADDGCTPSHTRRIFEGVRHSDKELYLVRGANHYYMGQPDKANEAVGAVLDWMRRHRFADA